MIQRRGIPNARPVEKPVLQAAIWVAAVLVIGFLALQTPPVIQFFAWVAEALAICAQPLLHLFGGDIIRTGVELRDTTTGHAIAVTPACDGSGLLLSATAMLAWFRARGAPMRSWPLVVAIALLSIFLFNLVRVLVIFWLIGSIEIMSAVHLYVAPLLSVVLVAGIVLYACRLRFGPAPSLPLLWSGVAIIGAALWYFAGYVATCATVVPLSNLWFVLLPDLLADAVICNADASVLLTSAAVSLKPPSVLNVPFYPADFSLALPLVLASLACLRQIKPSAAGAMASVVLFSIAMTLAGLTLGHDQAMASNITRLIGPAFSEPYAGPDPLVMAVLKTLQNALVHFNLFLLPVLLLRLDKSPGKRASSAQTPRRGGSRRAAS